MRDDPELHAEVYRLVDKVVTAVIRGHRKVPGVDTSAWWNAPDIAKIAGLLILSEAWVICDPERMVAERFKAASVAISEGDQGGWRRPSRSELAARRAQPGPMARPFDPIAARRWVETGDSREGAA